MAVQDYGTCYLLLLLPLYSGGVRQAPVLVSEGETGIAPSLALFLAPTALMLELMDTGVKQEAGGDPKGS